MSVLNNRFWNQIDTPRTKGGSSGLRETHWGLVIRANPEGEGTARLAEASLKVLAIGMLFAASFSFTAPTFETFHPMLKLALSAATLIIGAAVYLHAGRGFQDEVQIDVVQGELRRTRRNARGLSTVRECIPLNRTESLFLVRTKSGTAPATLCARITGRPRPVALASGRQHDLVPTLERAMHLIKSARRGRLG